MEQHNCLNCNTPIEGKEGKRAKKYCNDACRASHWSKTHSKKGIRWVRKEVYDAVVKERDELKALVAKDTYDGKVEMVTLDKLTPYFTESEIGKIAQASKAGSPVFYEMPKPYDSNKTHNEVMGEAFDSIAAKEKKQPVIKDKVVKKPIEDKVVDKEDAALKRLQELRNKKK